MRVPEPMLMPMRDAGAGADADAGANSGADADVGADAGSGAAADMGVAECLENQGFMQGLIVRFGVYAQCKSLDP